MKSLTIMGLVLVEVALWQWRVALTGRGQFLRGAVLGGFGAVIQITVVVRLVGDVGGVMSIAGYAGGVALGVAAGGLLDRRATPQMVKVQVITPSHHDLPQHLRAMGWPTTAFLANGHDERHLAELESFVDGVAPDAGWIVERIVSGRGLLTRVAA